MNVHTSILCGEIADFYVKPDASYNYPLSFNGKLIPCVSPVYITLFLQSKLLITSLQIP